MQFTSLTYLYLFFPVTLVLYYVFYRHMAKKGSCLIGNIILTLFSIVFYAAAGVRDVLILLIFVFFSYCLGLLVAWTRKKEAARVGDISTETGVSEDAGPRSYWRSRLRPSSMSSSTASTGPSSGRSAYTWVGRRKRSPSSGFPSSYFRPSPTSSISTGEMPRPAARLTRRFTLLSFRR